MSRSNPQTFKQGILLAVATAVLAGLFSLITTLVSESRQDRRQKREFSFSETEAARRTQDLELLAPGSPEVVPSPTIPPPVTPSSEDEGPRESPSEAVVKYYDLLNEGNYLQAWNRLSDDFRSRFNQDDFERYENFWRDAGQVRVIEVVQEEMPSDFQATLFVRMYWEADQSIRSNRYSMLLDLDREIWLIDEVGPID